MGHGKLIFRYGVMGSAKSAHLLMTGYSFEEQNRNVIYLKTSVDTRNRGFIESRTGLKKVCVTVDPEENVYYRILSEVRKRSLSEDQKVTILVDEIQFFSEKQIEDLSDLVDKFGYIVICYGIKTDCNARLFPGSKRLLELCDSIEEIKRECECGKKAIINGRWDGENFVLSDSQVEVGGWDKYKSVCRKCWKSSLEVS
jgi:Thymidine kinase